MSKPHDVKSTQTDNYSLRKIFAANNKYILSKMGLFLDFCNPKHNILCKIAFYFLLWNVNHLELRGQ